MRNKNLLTGIMGLGLLLFGWLIGASLNPQPEASPLPNQEPARADQPDGSKAEGQRRSRSAQQPTQASDRAFGTINSVGVDRFEIRKMDGTAQTVMVDGQTEYREGGRDAQKALHLEDLKTGDRVFVRGRTNENKEFIALTVRRVTEEETQRFNSERAFGEISSIDGNQIKVQNPRQGKKTVIVNEETVFIKEGQPITLKDLKVGDRIFALGKETNGQFVAARVFTGQFQQGHGQGRERQNKSENR